jgi:Arc/MetJ-type ribon-helix-helix transcriptional regulator
MPIRKTRNVSLPPELDAFVDDRVASGRYRSATEVRQRQPKRSDNAR